MSLEDLSQFSARVGQVRLTGEPLIIKLPTEELAKHLGKQLAGLFDDLDVIIEKTVAEKKHWLQRKLDVGHFVVIKKKEL